MLVLEVGGIDGIDFIADNLDNLLDAVVIIVGPEIIDIGGPVVGIADGLFVDAGGVDVNERPPVRAVAVHRQRALLTAWKTMWLTTRLNRTAGASP